MPELPEVETTLRGIEPFIVGQNIIEVAVRQPRLRWPIPDHICSTLKGLSIQSVTRRGKYLLLAVATGTIILHLGMSGSLRILPMPSLPNKHDHIDIIFSNNFCLRYTDPRRFGAFLWTADPILAHPLLMHLGPEPLSNSFTGTALWQRAKKRKVPIKSFIMDSKVVVGVGNIYATEALFAAGIHPLALACEISEKNYQALVKAIKRILKAAIIQGGTTLKDFVSSDGSKGYFKVHLKAYGRGGLPCLQCKTTLVEIRLNQRSTVYCPQCQR